MSRRTGLLAGVASLALMQLALIGAWCWKSGRQPRRLEFAVGEAVPDRPAPVLTLQRWDGSTTDLATAAAGRPMLVHFWATWCPPCREELPRFLAFGRRSPDVGVVAVALDERWDAVRTFLGREVPPGILRSVRVEEVAAWGTTELPETWLVSAQGSVTRRWQGAQEWASESAAATVAGALPSTRY